MSVRQPQHARCDTCGHVFVAVYLPMELRKYAQILKALHCPLCGADSKKVFVSDGSAPWEPKP
jgi:rubredoxin